VGPIGASTPIRSHSKGYLLQHHHLHCKACTSLALPLCGLSAEPAVCTFNSIYVLMRGRRKRLAASLLRNLNLQLSRPTQHGLQRTQESPRKGTKPKRDTARSQQTTWYFQMSPHRAKWHWTFHRLPLPLRSRLSYICYIRERGGYTSLTNHSLRAVREANSIGGPLVKVGVQSTVKSIADCREVIELRLLPFSNAVILIFRGYETRRNKWIVRREKKVVSVDR